MISMVGTDTLFVFKDRENMAGLLDLEGHLVFYRSYHMNHVNVTIHLLCIPMILLSSIAFLSPVNVLGDEHPFVNLGSILAWSYGLFYTVLDWQVGLPSFSLLVFAATVFKSIYTSLVLPNSILTQTEFVRFAITVHIISWIAQFYGHGVHEKRAPALIDNLLQALVLAPFFVAFEVAFWLGFKTDLQKTMNNKAGLSVRDFKQGLKGKDKAL